MTEYIVKKSPTTYETDILRVKHSVTSYRRREEIVRCRNCRHYHSEINGCDEFGDIWHDEYANVEPDGFCAWGERREQ